MTDDKETKPGRGRPRHFFGGDATQSVAAEIQIEVEACRVVRGPWLVKRINPF